MDALEAILTRRSTRRFSEKLPDRDLIGRVLDAGRHAPSGSNSQTTHLIVITDRAVLNGLAAAVQEEFARMELSEDMYISKKKSILASRKGTYVFHYGAPVLIVTANRKGYGNAMADSACVLENMMIAANALDLGSCWINQLHWLDESETIRKTLYSIGLREEETVTGGLALGYALSGKPNRELQKITGNPVTWAER
ncbi:MAG: nitroreductase [Clostridiales bacterium]|nr:nitroreductase [Clostridiales bacterium]